MTTKNKELESNMDNNPITVVQNLIYEIRGKRVMLDFDLAKLYQIETKVLKQAVRRNIERFPPDFMFTLSDSEYNSLILNIRSQFVTLEKGRGKYPKYAPFAFTEQGVAMLSSVLKSDVAIAANIAIMRAFVQVREYLMTTSTLSAELKELRAKLPHTFFLIPGYGAQGGGAEGAAMGFWRTFRAAAGDADIGIVADGQ